MTPKMDLTDDDLGKLAEVSGHRQRDVPTRDVRHGAYSRLADETRWRPRRRQGGASRPAGQVPEFTEQIEVFAAVAGGFEIGPLRSREERI